MAGLSAWILLQVTTKPESIERVLAAVDIPEALRTPNWDAFEEQVQEADRSIRLCNFDPRAAELRIGVRILHDALLPADA